MKDQDKTKQRLIGELAEMRLSVDDLRQAGKGQVESSVHSGPGGSIWQSLVTNTPVFILVLDRKGCIRFVNHTDSGVSLDQILGKVIYDFCRPEDRDTARACIREVFETGKPGLYESPGLRLDDEEHWYASYIGPIIEDGNVVAVSLISMNVTEKNKAEEELRRSEAKYRRLHDSMRDAFVSVTMDGRILECNEAYRQMLGYEAEELAGLTYQELTPSKWHAYQEEIIRKQVLVRGYSDIYEKEYRRKDGTLIPVELRTKLLWDDTGQPCGMWAIIRDITERKRAEAALQKAHHELEQRVQERTAELTRSSEALRWEIEERTSAQEALSYSHDELQAIYDNIVDGLLIGECITGKLLRTNPAICRMLGYSDDELLSMSASDIHPPGAVPEVVKMFRTQQVGERLVTQNRPMLRKDGTVFYADIGNTRISYQGRPCIVGIFRDITERKRAEEALERERQSLWKMLQASDQERRTISYEIHDGLAQYLAAAGMQLQVSDQLRERNPEEAKKAYDAATQLISQSHAEARRLISEVRPPVIDEAGIETAISHLVCERRWQGGPKLEFHSSVHFKRLPSILETALYRIAQEALTNACKHSKSKRVAVSMTQEGQEAYLKVQDWGIGFDPEAVEPGHFGLEGIRQRVRFLGGRLIIDSRPGSGTLVEVVVPILEQQAER
jgi:PAS domain S-box-containing protein